MNIKIEFFNIKIQNCNIITHDVNSKMSIKNYKILFLILAVITLHTKALKEAMCPSACKEVFYAEFEARLLKPGEDPSAYKWELEQILAKAEPNIDAGAKTVLLTRQFMKGLPQNIRLKLLENDPTPDLKKCFRLFNDTEPFKTTRTKIKRFEAPV